MSDNHAKYLEQIEGVIDHFCPFTPVEIKKRAEELYGEVKENDAISWQQIEKALIEIGRQDYPYRRAYHDLCHSDEEKRLREIVLGEVNDGVKEILNEVFSYNLMLDDFMKSGIFDEMSSDNRYELNKAIEKAENILEHQCDERADKQKLKFDELLNVRVAEMKELQAKIDLLRDWVRVHADHADELLAVVDRLESDWAIGAKGPQKEEIERELEYWQAILAESEGIGEFDLAESEEVEDEDFDFGGRIETGEMGDEMQ